MDYFKNLTFEKGSITVFGASSDSKFVSELRKYLNNANEVITPDNDGIFTMHSSEKIAEVKSSGYLVGVVSINVMEKKICEAVAGSEIFCKINDTEDDELVYCGSLARAVDENEKYDIMFIDDVDSDAKRYLAREVAKCIKSDMSVRMIDTDSNFTEILVK